MKWSDLRQSDIKEYDTESQDAFGGRALAVL
jgi:hypothetical protein